MYQLARIILSVERRAPIPAKKSVPGPRQDVLDVFIDYDDNIMSSCQWEVTWRCLHP